MIRGHAFIQHLRRGHYELATDARPLFRWPPHSTNSDPPSDHHGPKSRLGMACDRNATEPEKSLPQTVSVWQCDSRRGPDRELTALCRRLGSLHCLVGRISEVEQPEQHVTVLLRQRYVLGFVSADQHGESSEDPVQLEAVAPDPVDHFLLDFAVLDVGAAEDDRRADETEPVREGK